MPALPKRRGKPPYTPSLGLPVAVALLLAPASVCAEFRMEERDGILYVKNVEPAAVAIRGKPGAPTAADSYRPLIHDAAERHAVAPALIESVIRVESNFQSRAVSPKGARGLMQLMPETAARLGVRNVFDARENIEAGVRHLRYLMDRYQGNTSLALAAYNAGVDAVARHGGIPPYGETRAYVTRILSLVQQAGAVGGQSPIAARALYRYEGRDGRVVYSNLPIERLSSATRDILEGRE
jgi:soluble lytic murein transglycosylase-like protein